MSTKVCIYMDSTNYNIKKILWAALSSAIPENFVLV